MRAALRFGALLLLAAQACLPPPSIPRAQLEGWSHVDVGQVRLFGDLPPAELQRFADDLAVLDATFDHLVSWSPLAGALPVHVFLIRDRELARRFGLGSVIEGWVSVTLDGAFSVVLARANHTATRVTLFHEYTHVILHRGHRGPLPPWYEEGLARFFGTLDLRSGSAVVGAPHAASVVRLHGRGQLSLDELFEGFAAKRDVQYIADFYATSWALSHYLLLTPGGRSEMAQLVDELSRGVDPSQAQREAFGRSPSELESELRAHVGYLARGVPAEVLFEFAELDIRAAGRAAPLAFEEAAVALGEMALEGARATGGREYSALAVRLFEMAGARESPSTRFAAVGAEALALAGEKRKAAAALDDALARAPADPRVLRSAGRVELASANAADAAQAARALAAAEAHFRASLALDRGSASAWFGLGRAFHGAERLDEALDAYRSARRLGWSAHLDLAQGELELQTERPERAFQLLWPLVQDSHGGRTSDEARRLLERAGLLPEVP